jgi:YHS domain-containing protein
MKARRKHLVVAWLFAVSIAVGLLLSAGAVLACGGGSSPGSGCASHAQHKAGSAAGHGEHAAAPVVAAAKQESQDTKILQMKSLVNAPILINDPGALLAQADVLGLSEEQKARIQAVQKEAAAKATAILTNEQRQRLGDVTGRAVTLAQICSSVCPHTQHETLGSQVNEEQTICPVMGGKINKAIFTEYKGRKIYFCCPGCIANFEAEPEKYLAKLSASSVRLDSASKRIMTKQDEPQLQRPQMEHHH